MNNKNEQKFQSLFSKVCLDPNTLRLKVLNISVVVNKELNFVASLESMTDEKFNNIRQYLHNEGFLNLDV